MKHPGLPASLLWGVALAPGLACTPALGMEAADYGLKLKLSALGESPRDLGSSDADDTQEATLEINPEILLRVSPDFSSYLRLQAFAATDQVVLTDNNDQPSRTDAFAGLREFWIEYGGLSSYPGEVLRLGRQRLRQEDALWYDRDIESLRWIFDTTLLQANVGVAQAFDTYRTDDSRLPTELEDRLYVYGDVGREWQPAHRVGLRMAHAADREDAPALGAAASHRDKLRSGDLTWLGLHAENGYHELQRAGGSGQRLAYWAQVTMLTGDETAAGLDPLTGVVTFRSERDVRAWAGDLGLRLRVSSALPLQLGAAYAYGQGGSDDGESNEFRQTGLHSNRSRYTGTRTLVHRFNEALRAELSNLSVASLFASLQLEQGDASLVLHRFSRDDGESRVVTDGLDLQPVDGAGRDLGRGYDLVLTRYFGALKDPTDPEGDVQTALRLRASWFDPGDAYGGSATDPAYRVVLEGALQF